MNVDRRRHFGFVFVLLALFCGDSLAQRIGPGWIWQNPLPQGNQLNAIHFAGDKVSGFAVGTDNAILYTKNGGFTWEQQTITSSLSFSSVYTRDAKNAVIVGARGTVLITDNGGSVWRSVAIPTRDHLAAVTFVEGEPIGWTVGTYGKILKTADGGRTWAEQPSGIQDHLTHIAAFDEKRAIAVGENGKAKELVARA